MYISGKREKYKISTGYRQGIGYGARVDYLNKFRL